MYESCESMRPAWGWINFIKSTQNLNRKAPIHESRSNEETHGNWDPIPRKISSIRRYFTWKSEETETWSTETKELLFFFFFWGNRDQRAWVKETRALESGTYNGENVSARGSGLVSREETRGKLGANLTNMVHSTSRY